MRCFLQILLWTTPVVSVALAFSPPGDPNSPSATAVYGHKIINTYPHDANAFTQGLVFDGGVLYESTGGYGESTLREVELETGKVVRVRELPDEFFGEGVTIYGGKIIQLTWKARAGFVYDKETLRPLRTFKYPTEGWGVTHDGARLIMSDGTTVLHLLDPNSLRRIGGIRVHDNNSPVTGINELEYCRGRIYANIWPADRIAMIDPNTGEVTAWIDLTGLIEPRERKRPAEDILNGIAYDRQRDRLFVTGKRWPKLFEIELTPPFAASPLGKEPISGAQ